MHVAVSWAAGTRPKEHRQDAYLQAACLRVRWYQHFEMFILSLSDCAYRLILCHRRWQPWLALTGQMRRREEPFRMKSHFSSVK